MSISMLIRCSWRHRHTLEELDLDMEDNVAWGELYGEAGLEVFPPPSYAEFHDSENEAEMEYKEEWEIQ